MPGQTRTRAPSNPAHDSQQSNGFVCFLFAREPAGHSHIPVARLDDYDTFIFQIIKVAFAGAASPMFVWAASRIDTTSRLAWPDYLYIRPLGRLGSADGRALLSRPD